MDLSVSPDLSAYVCYGIVFLLGVFVAVVQVKKRLIGDGIWLVPQTWFLVTAYVGVPVVLYWLLDRTGAISDTSLFSAVLVGIGYERIITGGNQSVRAPGDVSSLWTPFLAYVDKIAKVVLERISQRQFVLADKIVTEITSDPNRYVELEKFAMGRSSDSNALLVKLNEIDGLTAIGAEDRLERKTRHLYGVVFSIPDIHYLLRNSNIISGKFYWMYVSCLPRVTSWVTISVFVLIALFVQVGFRYDAMCQSITTSYYVWRIGKINSTSADQYRSRRHLVALTKEQPSLLESTTNKLIYLIQRPGLPMERVDLVLQTLLESHGRASNNSLPQKLVEALRVSSLDARTRINEVLIYRSQSCVPGPDNTLRDWKPTDRDSSTMLEGKIDSWSQYWTHVCKPKGAET